MIKISPWFTAISVAFLFTSQLAFAQNQDSDEPVDDGISVLDRPDYNPNEPSYERVQPVWAMGFRTAIKGFPKSDAIGTTFQLYGDYILPFQKIGLISAGLHFGSFPLYAPETGIPYPIYENAIGGAQLRYQLYLSKGQWIVPTIAIEWEYFRIRESNFNQNHLTGYDFGASAGVFIYLSWLDRTTARDAYHSLGMVRSYFTAEIRSANINNDLFNLSGNYWLFGIRMEFE